MQGTQENHLRSLLYVNEEVVYRSVTPQLPCNLRFSAICVFYYLVGKRSLIPPNDPNTDEAS